MLDISYIKNTDKYRVGDLLALGDNLDAYISQALQQLDENDYVHYCVVNNFNEYIQFSVNTTYIDNRLSITNTVLSDSNLGSKYVNRNTKSYKANVNYSLETINEHLLNTLRRFDNNVTANILVTHVEEQLLYGETENYNFVIFYYGLDNEQEIKDYEIENTLNVFRRVFASVNKPTDRMKKALELNKLTLCNIIGEENFNNLKLYKYTSDSQFELNILMNSCYIITKETQLTLQPILVLKSDATQEISTLNNLTYWVDTKYLEVANIDIKNRLYDYYLIFQYCKETNKLYIIETRI